MKIKHGDVEIIAEEPFKNCKLGRQKYAERLTNIVNTYADGFVLAINNEWGTGKTTFVKMWQQHLMNAEFKTVYFNAWENDFESNPLIAIMGEFKTVIGKGKTDKTYKALTKKAGILTKNIIPTLSKAIASKFFESENINELIKKMTEAGTEIMEEEIEKYTLRKEGVLEFKKKLQEFVNEHTSGKPLIFIIDELDRCRPNFSVEVLEQVKHFFSVPGIVFVLSIDKIQLGHAVRGVYGSEQIDVNEYLRRFIDIEFILPKPNTIQSCKYLLDYFNFNQFFDSPLQSPFQNQKTNFIDFAAILFDKENLSLRKQEKFFAHSFIVINSLMKNKRFPLTVIILLIFLRQHHFEFYKNLSNKVCLPQKVISELEKLLFQLNTEKRLTNYFLNIIAMFVTIYKNFLGHDYGGKLYEYNIEGNTNEIFVFVEIDTPNSKKNFLSFLEKNESALYGITMDYILDKIEMIDDVEI